MDRKAWDLWQMVRQQNPLVQCITNFVSMVRCLTGTCLTLAVFRPASGAEQWRAVQDLMANVLLASGASPAMVSSLGGGACIAEDLDDLTDPTFTCRLTLLRKWRTS